MKTIVSMKFGSHLYGTNTPESDLDFKAVHVPPARDILLQRAKGSVSVKRAKSEGEKNFAGEVDEENYSLQRFLQLLSEGQTVAIDMLFAPDSALLESSDLWEYVRENRARFLSKRSAAFVGYCRQQANKYGIKGSRVAAAKEAMEFFAGILVARGPLVKVVEVAEFLPLGEHASIVEQQINKAGDLGQFFECCNRKVGFQNTVKEAHAIFARIYENYGSRAKLAQDNEGVDWKALSHAVRVGNEALELLMTGAVTFPLPNAAHILDIKKGRLPYNQVAEEIEGLLEAVERASQESALPEQPDKEFIDDLVTRVHYRAITESLRKALEQDEEAAYYRNPCNRATNRLTSSSIRLTIKNSQEVVRQ